MFVFLFWQCRGAERRVGGAAGDGSIKFTFEEDEDEDGKQWMFCHVPGCSFWTSKSFRMQRHKLCHSEPSELEVKRCYKCPDCHLKFYSLAKLLKHDRRKHTGIKDYECRICGAEVTDIQTHMRVHTINTRPRGNRNLIPHLETRCFHTSHFEKLLFLCFELQKLD